MSAEALAKADWRLSPASYGWLRQPSLRAAELRLPRRSPEGEGGRFGQAQLRLGKPRFGIEMELHALWTTCYAVGSGRCYKGGDDSASIRSCRDRRARLGGVRPG